MQLKEGESPRSLSDYVSGVFADRAQQEAEASWLKDLSTQAHLKQFIQETTPLREYLSQLAAPMDDLLGRFRVRELFDEICSTFWPGSRLVTLEPPIYRSIVTDRDPATQQFWLKSQLFNLDQLKDPDYFKELIPKLEGYGLAVRLDSWTTVPAVTREKYWSKASGGSRQYLSGTDWTTSTWSVPAGWSERNVERGASVVVSQMMEVEIVDTAHSKTSGYDLVYSYQLQRTDLRDIKLVPLDKRTYLTQPTRVNGSEPLEVLKRLIGDDIISYLNGEHEELVKRFKTKGQRKQDDRDAIWDEFSASMVHLK